MEVTVEESASVLVDADEAGLVLENNPVVTKAITTTIDFDRVKGIIAPSF